MDALTIPPQEEGIPFCCLCFLRLSPAGLAKSCHAWLDLCVPTGYLWYVCGFADFTMQQYSNLKMAMASLILISEIISRLGQPCWHWFVYTTESSMQPSTQIVLLIPGEFVIHNHFHNNNKSLLFPCQVKIIQVNNTQFNFDSNIEPETKAQRGTCLRKGRYVAQQQCWGVLLWRQNFF